MVLTLERNGRKGVVYFTHAEHLKDADQARRLLDDLLAQTATLPATKPQPVRHDAASWAV